METKIKQSLIGGVVATIVMSVFMFLISFIGFPKMNPPAMLSGMMGMPVFVGWFIHLMIGVIFALAYAYFLFNLVKKAGGKVVRGLIFGVAVFIFAQIMFALMGAVMGGMPPQEGSMVLLMIASLLGHVVYGIVVAAFVTEKE
ncbi:MAG: hypothetical protein KFF73_05780 [Cyclobacteriaceae bacterium]|nr:hypothetical protein [Cyclobacteriaceae bacterium]